MTQSNDPERIDALRKRLYDRGATQEKRKRHKLSVEIPKVRSTFAKLKPQKKTTPDPVTTQSESAPEIHQSPTQETKIPTEDMAPRRKKRGYRIKLLLAGVLFFLGALIVSSIFLVWGGSTISGENIAINLSGPFTVGGGEVIPLQVGITNQNNVPIDSATLIIEYPLGTQSATDEGRELFVERLALESIASGQTINLPFRAQVFGEENDELLIRASVEYRVAGSNATFFKDAEPLRFKIGSSPVVIDVEAVKKISSGQETDVTVTVKSNAPEVLTDIILSAEYPLGFDFSSALPKPDAGQNVWSIDRLEPEEEVTITLTGIVVGRETDEYGIEFSVGVPNQQDPFSLASVFGTAVTDFEIEQPFLGAEISVNNVRTDNAVMKSGDLTNVAVEVENTLGDTIYDGVIVVSLSGNALSESVIDSPKGFYDSNNNTITWDISSVPELERIAPGATQRFSFTILPNATGQQTPSVNVDATVKARRALEGDTSAELLGNISALLKVETEVALFTETTYDAALLKGSGPVPPKVGEKTVYALSMRVLNGNNEISNGVVTATLPSYVTWVDSTYGTGEYSYNDSTREVRWEFGSLDANNTAIASFQVSLLPSSSQLGKTPTLLGEQRLKADDLFTGELVREVSAPLTTEIPTGAGYDEENGVVE